MQETKYANARSVMEMVKLGAFATEIGAAAKDAALLRRRLPQEQRTPG